MKLKPRILPYIGLTAGILALAARTWLFTTGIDERGLLSTTHPANTITYFLTAAVMALLFLTVRPLKETPPYTKLFKRSIPACIGSVAAAVGILFTTFTEFRQSSGLITLVACLLGVLAALSLVLTGIFRALCLRPAYYFHAAVTAYFMMHILSQYQNWNIEPQLQRYLPQLLASVFLMLAAYQRTALDADAGNVRNFLFFQYGALFFSCLAIGSTTPVFYFSMAIWTATVHCDAEKQPGPAFMELPEEVQLCINTLERSGHSAYAVGGCVRDSLLGLTPHDYDLCTSAKPERICELFEGYTLVRNGEKHGTIGVVINGKVYEITTYRTEGSYSDSRHPDWVAFVDTIEKDLARRDFTVNAMAFSPTRGYIDPFHGQKDLSDRVLRAVGDPETRFREDALRILRGVRFAVRFRLEPEAATLDAMLRCAPLMDDLAKERILTELCGLLPLAAAADLQRYAPILTQIIPELTPCLGFDQKNPHHAYDVYTHIATTVEAVPKDTALRFAALLHDIGKPACYTEDESGNGHFYGHAKASAEIANNVLARLKAPTALRERVVFLIENHMVLFEPDKKLLRRRISKYSSDAALQLLSLQEADLIATGTEIGNAPEVYARIRSLISEILEEESCLSVKDLAISGNDLIEAGMEPGPRIGLCLDSLLEQVLDETLPNEKEPLLEAAKALEKLSEI